MEFKRLMSKVALVCVILWVDAASTAENSNFYSLKAQDLETLEEVSMSKYSGKVLLIVNVASECGYTEEHYRELVELQLKFASDKFQVLAFPSNEFGNQEPNKNSEILRFAQDTYNVNFPMFAKIETMGESAHPIYTWLKEQTGGYVPNWNFCKYILDASGKVCRFATTMTPASGMTKDIETLINGGKLKGGIYIELAKEEF